MPPSPELRADLALSSRYRRPPLFPPASVLQRAAPCEHDHDFVLHIQVDPAGYDHLPPEHEHKNEHPSQWQAWPPRPASQMPGGRSSLLFSLSYTFSRFLLSRHFCSEMPYLRCGNILTSVRCKTTHSIPPSGVNGLPGIQCHFGGRRDRTA